MKLVVLRLAREVVDAVATVEAENACRQAVQLLVPPSGLVTIRSRVPAWTLAAALMLAVMDVELLNVTELTVIPLPLTATVAPLTNPLPVIVSVCESVPAVIALGERAVVAGAGSTAMASAPSALELSGLVTVTFREPVEAVALTETVAVSDVALL